MGPKRYSTASNSRLPVKAITPYGLGSLLTDHNDLSGGCPHDSLASNDNKATGYFLQFTPAKTSPVKSPTKPSPSKSLKMKTTPTKLTPTKSSQIKSSIPRTPPTKPKPFTFQTASRSRPAKRQSPTNTKTRIPKPKPNISPTKSDQFELKRPPPSGFRTRSVSPKVLKPQDRFLTDNQTNEDMQIVADKCNVLLSSFGGHNSHSEPQHSMSDLGGDNRGTEHQITCVNTSKSEEGDKRTNNILGAEPSSESIVRKPHSFIDPLSSNINNTSNSEFTASAEFTGDFTSPSVGIGEDIIGIKAITAQPEESTYNHHYSQQVNTSLQSTISPQTLNTTQPSNHSLRNNPTQSDTDEQSSDQLNCDEVEYEPKPENRGKDNTTATFLSSPRCQEQRRCDDLTEDVIESTVISCSEEAEVRASNDLCTDTYHHREAEREADFPLLDDCDRIDGSSSLENTEEEKTPAFSDSSVAKSPTQPEPTRQTPPNATKMASSSWMDRLKEVCLSRTHFV